MNIVNNSSVVYVPSGTVCFNCNEINIFEFDIEFFISEKVKNSSYTVTAERSNNELSSGDRYWKSIQHILS